MHRFFFLVGSNGWRGRDRGEVRERAREEDEEEGGRGGMDGIGDIKGERKQKEGRGKIGGEEEKGKEENGKDVRMKV